ncbi:hypothetical protein [Botrimarina hoheduenensis]|nr:hypothetical protein [Botrimarina hoheduenensis]
MAANPKAGPTEVCNELKKKGIEVAPALVSNVKAAAARKAGKKPRKKVAKKRGVGRPAGSVSDKVSLSSLIDAREFASKVGGVEQAEKLLKALSKLG